MTQQLDMLGILLDEPSARRLSLPQPREVRKPRMALIDVPRAANADPETSHLAAARIRDSGALGRQQRIVLDAVKRWPGSTSAELADHITNCQDGFYADWRSRTGRRLPELAKVHIRKGEPKVCRKTGVPCVTWWPL